MARRKEFSGSLLRFPVQTAVKTGTSSGYHDAWAIGYSSKYTVGVWMGDLNRTAMKEVSGSIGPALVLRAVFGILERSGETRPLFVSKNLKEGKICAVSGLLANDNCPAINEKFRGDSVPTEHCHLHSPKEGEPSNADLQVPPNISLPTPGLQLAMDPRTPDQLEAFPFELEGAAGTDVKWVVDNEVAGISKERNGRFLWNLKKGEHLVFAEARGIKSQSVRFWVK
jgi:penicillin-binding protein 1C